MLNKNELHVVKEQLVAEQDAIRDEINTARDEESWNALADALDRQHQLEDWYTD